MKELSQKEKFIREIERRIISGELKCGDMLPPERELVAELNMSRTVIHTGLAELSSLGFIRTRPRKGYVVTDYQTEGTIAVLESIMHFNGGNLAPDLFDGMLDCRQLVEIKTASLAAENHNEQDMQRLNSILQSEYETESIAQRADLDFSFHHAIAIASGNPIYPLILKSFEPLQKQFIETFYSIIEKPAEIYTNHQKLIKAIENGDSQKSTAVMQKILDHGKKMLIRRK